MKTLTQHDELLVKPYIDSKIQTLTNQVKDMNNVYGSKNLLPLTKRTGGTQSGVTFTVNDNGSITVNGTATSGIGMNETVNKIFLGIIPKGEYLISCKKDKTTVAQAYYTITNGVSNIPVEEDKVLSLDSDTTLNMWIYVSANVTYDNVTFYPMIRLASIEDDTYAPYAKTNRELTGYADNTEVNGAVNMLPNNATTQTVNGITFTVNDDGSVTANGTSTGYTPLVIAQHGQASFFDDFIGKPIKLSGCPSDGASNTYKLRFGYASGNYVDDVGEGVIITPTAGNSNTWYVEIGISGGVTVSNLTFKPMITVPSYNGDYVPYAKSNKELTEDVSDIVKGGAYVYTLPTYFYHIAITASIGSGQYIKLVTIHGELNLATSSSAIRIPTGQKVLLNQLNDASTWTYSLDGLTANLNSTGHLVGYIISNHPVTFTVVDTSTPEAHTLDTLNLALLSNS